jgi:hypothetical protein
MSKKRKRLTGTVQKVIKPVNPRLAEKAQIEIEEAEDLYREIRIENKLTDDHGNTSELKEGSEVEVIVEIDSDGTGRKPA